MRYKHGLAEVEAEGMGETEEFGIALSAKVFRSLIDNLYSRKIEAGIRELSTNAFDAHIAAGIIRPFHVHLPTTFEPVFRIRDYGVSMAHELVMHRYTTLGDSTKDESDDEVGMLGYGSKSPFAYTDAFSLICWLDGEKRTYAVYVGPNGRPRCSLVAKEPTDEENGVAVEFPVKATDLADFEQAAIRVYKGFPIAPDGLPQTVRDALAVMPVETGPSWKVFPKDYLGGGFFARQGCVLYPIDLTHLLSEKEAKAFGSVGLSIILDFPIGALSFVNSREFLSYDTDTVKALKEHFHRFRSRLDRELNKKLRNARSPWDQRNALHGSDLLSTYGGLFSHLKAIKTINGLPELARNMMPASRTSTGVFFSYINSKETVAYSRRDNAFPNNLPPKIVFVYRDRPKGKLPVGPNLRIVQYLNQHGFDAAFTFNKLKLKDWRRLGKPTVLRLSDLPPPPRTYSSKGSTGGGGGFCRWKLPTESGFYLRDAEEEETEGRLFAFVNRGQIITPPGYPEWRLGEVLNLDGLLKRFTGQRIAFINMRSNESFEKFPEEQFPRFYGCEKDILASLTRNHVRDAINVLNNDRFQGSKYDRALDKLDHEGSHNPLLALHRFKHRVNRMDQAAVLFWQSVMTSGLRLNRMIREHVIDLALEAGLEVLPTRQSAVSGWSEQHFPYPLLPKKWERFVDYMTMSCPDHNQMMKDLFTC